MPRKLHVDASDPAILPSEKLWRRGLILQPPSAQSDNAPARRDLPNLICGAAMIRTVGTPHRRARRLVFPAGKPRRFFPPELALQTVCPRPAPKNRGRSLFESAAAIERPRCAACWYTIREILSR